MKNKEKKKKRKTVDTARTETDVRVYRLDNKYR